MPWFTPQMAAPVKDGWAGRAPEPLDHHGLLPGCTSRELARKQSSWDLNWRSDTGARPASGGLAHCATTLSPKMISDEFYLKPPAPSH